MKISTLWKISDCLCPYSCFRCGENFTHFYFRWKSWHRIVLCNHILHKVQNHCGVNGWMVDFLMHLIPAHHDCPGPVAVNQYLLLYLAWPWVCVKRVQWIQGKEAPKLWPVIFRRIVFMQTQNQQSSVHWVKLIWPQYWTGFRLLGPKVKVRTSTALLRCLFICNDNNNNTTFV